jgi:GNAT superfamily N-acetyltransferase
MHFADIELAHRLEFAEAYANRKSVEARAKISPGLGATWAQFGAAYAMFDGVGSPLTQTFGLGLGVPVDAPTLDQLEQFFLSRGSDVFQEVCPLAGVEVQAILASRGYTPIELTSVMFRPLAGDGGLGVELNPRVRVRETTPADSDVFVETAVGGWSEYQEVAGMIGGLARMMVSRADVPAFIAELDGRAIATGAMWTAGTVALMAGASTVPDARKQGAQRALLDARLRAAKKNGCDLAMMCAAPGSSSQRNAERNGFRIAYTRTKWQRRR